MAKPTKDKTAEELKAADGKELGVGPGIVASGEMFKEGLIWGLLVTAASWGLLAFGRREPNLELGIKGNWVHTVAEYIHEGHGKIKGWIGEGARKIGAMMGKEVKPDHAVDPAITATSFIIGGIAAKVVLPTAAVHGANRGKKAVEKYSNVKTQNRELVEKNNELKESNGLLTEDVARLNEALAKVQRPDPMAEKEASATRSV